MGQTIFDPNSIVFVSRGVIQMLKWYYIEKLKNEEQYVEFIEYMLKNSDFFSVVYFRYNERESLRRSVKQIRDELRKYKIYSKICIY